jgi:uncharacterized protein YidB (DUF937 family)
MSLFDDLAKGAMSMLGGDKGGNLAGVAMDLLTKDGGLNGLVQKFEQAGMGDMIKGWISTGPNPEISADQLSKVLGSDMVSKLAGSAGINPQDLLSQLSTNLPSIIDKLTPDGVAPDASTLEKGLGGLLGGLLKK